uniref:Tjp1 n=1 Tax=Symphyonema bifilamentata 97.28 TaxID=2721247 RepID=A0A6H0DWY5_9CYAN|nr:Tjp1 [Symphyonema bifilamentata 97.28]
MNIETKLQQCKRANHQPSKHVTILGAGIAGLIAAYELERLGHQVDVMEGSPRIGGRIWTHRFGDPIDGPYGELGAMRIPPQHEYVLHYVQTLGLGDKLRKFVTMFEEHNALVNIDGTVLRIQDAPRSIQMHYRGVFVDERYSEKTRLFAAWLKTIVDAIGSGELRECLERDLNSHLMDELKKLDLDPFFDVCGKTIDLHAFIKAYPSFRNKCSKALNIFLSDILIETSHDLWQLEGGMDQLIHSLAAAINGPIRCNQNVVALRVYQDGVEISWLEAGKLHTRLCDYVLCTIPFSVLRQIELSGLDEDKLATIHNIIYWPATKVLFLCARPFWQESGIFGGASFSDDAVRQIYYPSTKSHSSLNSVLLASYTIGNDARYLGMMSEQERHSYVKEALSKLHPEIKVPGTLLDMTSIAWGNYKWSAAGCSIPWDRSAFYQSPQHQDAIPHTESVYHQKAASPQNTLFFAGEHCSKLPAWLQGSVESALQAVYDIVSHNSSVNPNKKPSLVLEKG